jgi:hypothetical protein
MTIYPRSRELSVIRETMVITEAEGGEDAGAIAGGSPLATCILLDS